MAELLVRNNRFHLKVIHLGKEGLKPGTYYLDTSLKRPTDRDIYFFRRGRLVSLSGTSYRPVSGLPHPMSYSPKSSNALHDDTINVWELIELPPAVQHSLRVSKLEQAAPSQPKRTKKRQSGRYIVDIDDPSFK